MKKTLLSILLAGTMLSSVAVAGINPVNIDESTHSKNIYKAIKSDIADGKKSGVDSGFAWVEVNGKIHSVSLQSIRNATDPAKAFAAIVKEEAVVEQLAATTAKIAEVKGDVFEAVIGDTASLAELNVAKSRISFLEAKEALLNEYVTINADGDLTAEEIEEQLVDYTDAVKEAHGEYLGLIHDYVEGVYATAKQTGIDSRNAEVAGLKSDIVGLEANIVTANGIIDGLNADLTAEKATVAGLEVDLAAEKTKVAGLEVDLANAEADVIALKGALFTETQKVADRDTTIARLESDIVGFEAEIAAGKVTVDGLVADLATADSTITTLTANLAAEEVKVADLTADLATANISLATANGVIDGLNTDIATANGVIDGLNAELVTAAETLKSTQDQAIIDIAASHTAGINSVVYNQDPVPATLSEIDGFSTYTHTFHEIDAAGTIVYNDALKSGDYLVYDIATGQITIGATKGSNGLWTTQTGSYTGPINGTSGIGGYLTVTTGQAAVDALVVERDALVVEVTTLTTERNALMAEVADLEAAAIVNSNMIDALNGQIDDLNLEVSNLMAEITAKDASIDSLLTQVADLSTTIDAKDATIVSKDAEIATLSTQLSTAVDNAAAIQVSLDAANAEVVELKAEVLEANDMIGTLTGQLSDAQSALTDAETLVASLEGQLTASQADVNSLQSQLADVKEQLDNVDTSHVATVKGTYTGGGDVAFVTTVDSDRDIFIGGHLENAYQAGRTAGIQFNVDSEVAKVTTSVGHSAGVITVTAQYEGNPIGGSASTFTLQDGINITPAIVDGVVNYSLSFDLPEYAFAGVDSVNYDANLDSVQSNGSYVGSTASLSDFIDDAALQSAIDDAYQSGFDDGYDAGYKDGYADGFADGRATK